MFQPLTMLSWARRLLGMKAPLASEVLCDDCYRGWELFVKTRPWARGERRERVADVWHSIRGEVSPTPAVYDAALKAFINAERQ